MTTPGPFPFPDRLLSPPFEGELFHYTSSEALLAILTHKTLWASDINYLNDVNELRHTLALARGYLGPPSLKAALASERSKLIDQLGRRLDNIRYHFFVFSLSEEPDLLSQWRGYCPTAGGYSIGFSARALYGAARTAGFELAPCSYDSTQQLADVGRVLESAFDSYDREVHPQLSPERRADAFFPDLSFRLGRLAPLLKHPSFSEEKEWRLVSDAGPSDHSAINYRASRRMLIPYLTIPLSSGEVFTRIIVGPSEHQALAIRSVEGLLKKLGLPQGVVYGSAVPFRTL